MLLLKNPPSSPFSKGGDLFPFWERISSDLPLFGKEGLGEILEI
jgi:hypothetical protein